ncbi:hypothetical protein DLR60_11845 [Vibrio tarriae]|uniref:hypothetical protein n=1 Tax=Vibrio TaxID=662 RepID=UPI0005B65550|nr:MULTISPECIES: hypothetical protein [Vibrio]RBM68044.1 hypothetical protein DLR60_11845 [Vibrio tarriae]
MKKYVFLSTVLLVMATPSLAKGIFLEDLINTEYNITDNNSWKNSPYTIDETPQLNAFTGDRCSTGTKEHLNTYPDSSRNRNVECYVTHFPNSDVKTHIQSNDNGDVSVGFSWDFN